MRWHILPLPVLIGIIGGLFVTAGSLAQMPAVDSTQTPPQERSVRILPESADKPALASPPPFPAARLEQLNAALNLENPAGLSLSLIPGSEVVAGSKIGFRITTKKQGYVVLLDVDINGKLTQIFPDAAMMARESADTSNLIKPGRPLTFPQLGSANAGFEFVAQPPSGLAMLVALLSDKPVQIVDLPDAPPPAFAPDDALKYVRDKTRTLKIPTADGRDLQQPNWSFAGKFYLIK